MERPSTMMIDHTVLPSMAAGSADTAAVATAINGRGWIAGHMQAGVRARGTATYHAALWTPDGVTDLGTLGQGDLQRSFAEDLNDAGDVVGWCTTTGPAGLLVTTAFHWSADAGLRPLQPLVPGRSAQARAIDNRGRIAGVASDTAGVNRAVVWTAPDSAPADLGFAGTVVALNDVGQLVGSSGSRAFMWSPDRGLIMLGTLGGRFAAAQAINARGDVVGVAASPDGASRPFLWTVARGMRSLGLPPDCIGAAAYAINDAGAIAVAGHVRDPIAKLISSRAWLYIDGDWVDLGPDGHSTAASDVNDSLQVIGFGAAPDDGTLRALRWDTRPLVSTTTTAPAPPTRLAG